MNTCTDCNELITSRGCGCNAKYSTERGFFTPAATPEPSAPVTPGEYAEMQRRIAIARGDLHGYNGRCAHLEPTADGGYECSVTPCACREPQSEREYDEARYDAKF